MLLFKLIKLTRRLRILLGGYRKMELHHYLFTLEPPLVPLQIYDRLIPLGYQYNFMSTTFKYQIFTCRKLDKVGTQYHLRFYRDGKVSGHYELDPYFFPLRHLVGEELHKLTQKERQELKKALGDR